MFSLISLPSALAVLAVATILPHASHASPLDRTIGQQTVYRTSFHARDAILGDQQHVLNEPTPHDIPTTSLTAEASQPTKAPWLAVVITRTTATTTISNGTMPTAPTAPNIVWQRGVMKQKEHVVASKQFPIAPPWSAKSSGTAKLCGRPSPVNEHQDWQPIWGSWNDTIPSINEEPIYMTETQLQLPFLMCIGGQCSRLITVGTDGYFYLDAVRGEVKMEVFSGQSRGLYLYPMQRNGVFFRISGDVGSRELVLAWYAGTLQWEHEQNYFTATYREDQPGSIIHNYHSMIQSGSGPQAQASVKYPSRYIVPWPKGNVFVAGMQLDFETGNGLEPPNVRLMRHNVVACQ